MKRKLGTHKHRKAQETEILAIAMLVIFSAYVFMLANSAVGATAMATGSVSFAQDGIGSTGLITSGSNAYSIVLMFVLSLAFLAPVEIWLRRK